MISYSSSTASSNRGQVLRDYVLKNADGESFQLSDFRGRQNLLLILFPSIPPDQIRLLETLSNKFEQVRDLETRVIVVVRPEQLFAVPALPSELVLATAELESIFAELAPQAAAIYVTDKFREVFHLYRVNAGDPLPSVGDLLSWVEFTALHCPECHPPEWPADAL